MLGTVKTSVLLFYGHVFCFQGHSRYFDTILRLCVLLVVSWTLAFTVAFFFMCRTEFSVIWSTLDDTIMKCVNTATLTVGFVFSDFIMDVLILVLPIPKVSDLVKYRGRG